MTAAHSGKNEDRQHILGKNMIGSRFWENKLIDSTFWEKYGWQHILGQKHD
jgi:hypothetical protein